MIQTTRVQNRRDRMIPILTQTTTTTMNDEPFDPELDQYIDEDADLPPSQNGDSPR